ncbi:MAG TPA: hypothetical protein VKV25_06380 [Acidimicrobiales bacterium]|nr:hypothetical protein [Acidimicrobiales bacterium]
MSRPVVHLWERPGSWTLLCCTKHPDSVDRVTTDPHTATCGRP